MKYDYSVHPTEPRIVEALRRIEKVYGDVCSIQEADQAGETVYGWIPDVDIADNFILLWQNTAKGVEVLKTDNDINACYSVAAADIINLRLTGHTLAAGKFTRKVQTLQVLGSSTIVNFPTKLARLELVENIDDSQGFTGTAVFADSGAPTTHIFMDAESSLYLNRSTKAAFTVPDQEYFLMTDWGGGITKATTADTICRLRLRTAGVTAAGVGKPFIVKSGVNLSSNGGDVKREFDPILIIPPNTDVQVLGATSTNSAALWSWMHGFRATVVT